jgi:hypothetical protein
VDDCELRQRLLGTAFACDEHECVFWAALGPEGESVRPQCAVKYFGLLDAPGRELAEWFLSLKEDQVAEVLGRRLIPPVG